MIHYRNDVRRSGIDARALKRTAEALLTAAHCKGAELSVLFVNDEAMRRLNKQHRNQDKATDVLSFGAFDIVPADVNDGKAEGEAALLGDVVISVDTAQRQAAQYDATLQDEVYRLLIHGILHVLGHDHEKGRERERMEAEERRLAAAIGLTWPYP